MIYLRFNYQRRCCVKCRGGLKCWELLVIPFLFVVLAASTTALGVHEGSSSRSMSAVIAVIGIIALLAQSSVAGWI